MIWIVAIGVVTSRLCEDRKVPTLELEHKPPASALLDLGNSLLLNCTLEGTALFSEKWSLVWEALQCCQGASHSPIHLLHIFCLLSIAAARPLAEAGQRAAQARDHVQKRSLHSSLEPLSDLVAYFSHQKAAADFAIILNE